MSAAGGKLDDEAKEAKQSAAIFKTLAEEQKQQILDLQQKLKATQSEVADARTARDTAVLRAAQQLEARFEAAYQHAHQEEVAALQAKLEEAVEAARAAEVRALEASRASAEETALRTQEAVQQVTSESASAVSLAKGASSMAQLAAEEAGESAQRSAEQQMKAMALVKEIQAHAEASGQRAAAAHQQAEGLAAEVTGLRDALAAAQAEAAEAVSRAVAAEKQVADRIAAVDAEARAQMAAVEKAFEELKRVERQRAKEALDEVQALSKQNAQLVEEAKNLRAGLAAAEHAVAQADGKAAGIAGALKQQEEQLTAQFEERLAAQAQEMQAQMLKEQLEEQRDRWREVAEEVRALSSSIDTVEEEASGQVKALSRAVEAQGQERTYWRARCVKAEGEARLLGLQLKKALDALGPGNHDLGVGLDNNGPVPRRLSAVLRQEKLWQFMAAGPRGPSTIAAESAPAPVLEEDLPPLAKPLASEVVPGAAPAAGKGVSTGSA